MSESGGRETRDSAFQVVGFVQLNTRRKPKPEQHWTSLPSAMAQIKAIRLAARHDGAELVHTYGVIRPSLTTSPLAQPALHDAIRHAKKLGGAVLVDDVYRLVHGMEYAAALEALKALIVSKAPIFSIAHGALLPRIPPQAIRMRLVAASAAAEESSRRVKDGLQRRAQTDELGNVDSLQKASRRGVRANRKKAEIRALRLAPVIQEIRTELPPEKHSNCRAIMRALNERKVPSPRGGAWSDVQVRRTLERLEKLKAEESLPGAAEDLKGDDESSSTSSRK